MFANNGTEKTPKARRNHFITQLVLNYVPQLVGGAISLIGSKSIQSPIAPQPPEAPSREVGPKAEVTRILNTSEIVVSDEILDKIVEKFPTMQDIPRAGLSIEDRVINYAKALQIKENIANVMDENANAPVELEGVIAAVQQQDNQKFKEAWLQIRREQVEFYDTNNDGLVSEEEYIAVLRKANNENSAVTDAMAELLFTMLNRNNSDNVLDATELATEIFAAARMDSITGGLIEPNDANKMKNALSALKENLLRNNKNDNIFDNPDFETLYLNILGAYKALTDDNQ